MRKKKKKGLNLSITPCTNIFVLQTFIYMKIEKINIELINLSSRTQALLAKLTNLIVSLN